MKADYPQNKTENTPNGISRRSLLQGLGLSLAWSTGLPLPSAYASTPTLQLSTTLSRVVIYADSAHFSANPHLQTYTPAASHGAATRDYVESISQQEFLTRHWFA